ncbi:hypothetical protein KCV01_g3139, partial [Aureobasidium melanogenum]
MTSISPDHVRENATPTQKIYGAYGDTRVPTGMALTGYAGQTLERAFGGYFLGGRFYIPWLRRFLAPDPASPFDIGGFNRYAYCLGDPINRIDPSGHASFGWLGKLLGSLWIAGQKAAHAINHATPTTVITQISRISEIVSVATVIGAAAAVALDAGPAATILGLVAAGGHGIGVSLGMAGKAMGRAGRATNRSTIDEHTLRSPPGRVVKQAGDNQRYVRTTYPLGGGGQIKYYEGHAATDKLISNRRVHNRHNGQRGPIPNWSPIRNKENQGINWVVDTPIRSADVEDAMRTIGQNHAAGHESYKPILVLSGAHGSPDGFNWMNGNRAHQARGFAQIDANKSATYAQLAGVKMDDFDVLDITKFTNAELAQVMNVDAHIVHAYCFSAVDREILFHFGMLNQTLRIYSRRV